MDKSFVIIATIPETSINKRYQKYVYAIKIFPKGNVFSWEIVL